MQKLTVEELLAKDLSWFDTCSVEELEGFIETLESAVASDHITQMTLKILINSLYGALANSFFLLANPDMAAAITSSGRFFIQLVASNVERELQALLPSEKPYICYGDTDSFYYTLQPIVSHKFGENADASTPGIIDWVDSFEKKVIQRIIQDSIAEYAEILNIDDPSQIGVEREIISDRAFFVAKKRYAARVLDSEGVRFSLDDPYIKTMGLEIARSSTPAWVKKKLQESISVILDNDQYGVRKWRDETKLQYQDQPLEDICAVQGVSSLDYNINDKGIPQGSKAAIAHNNWVKQQGLEDSIELLQPGEKYKRCYLLTPNRFGTEIISFGDSKIAKIIEEDGIFDYQTNFQKQFEQPLERMVESMNYDIRDVPVFGSLDDW
nr:MAG TPA: DNA polymerase [Caudoviricetes sp.]DAU04675.1 MAG TPA: DNA polymerase [Caudoviricetes sp.]